MSINDSWSQPPASGSGHNRAAPVIHHGPERQHPSEMTIDGRTPSELAAAAQVQQQQAAVTNTTAADAFSTIQSGAKELGCFLEDLAGKRSELTQEGVQTRISEFASGPTVRAVDQAVASVRQHRDAQAAEVQRVRDSLIAQGDAAQEQRNGRTWARAKTLLDSAEDGKVGIVARQAISNASRDQLGVLLEEIPTYLESRGHQSDWIDVAAAQAVPELDQAQQAARQAEREFETIRYDAQTFRNSLENGSVPAVLVDPSKI